MYNFWIWFRVPYLYISLTKLEPSVSGLPTIYYFELFLLSAHCILCC